MNRQGYGIVVGIGLSLQEESASVPRTTMPPIILSGGTANRSSPLVVPTFTLQPGNSTWSLTKYIVPLGEKGQEITRSSGRSSPSSINLDLGPRPAHAPRRPARKPHHQPSHLLLPLRILILTAQIRQTHCHGRARGDPREGREESGSAVLGAGSARLDEHVQDLLGLDVVDETQRETPADAASTSPVRVPGTG